MKLLKNLFLLGVLLGAGTLFGQQAASTDGEVLEDTWMTLDLQGAQVGHYHILVRKAEIDGAWRYVTDSESFMSMARLGQATEFSGSSTTVEDLEGSILSVESMMKLSANPTWFTGTVEDGVMHGVIRNMGRETPKNVEWEPGVLSERAVGLRTVEMAGKEEGATMTFPSFSAEMQKIVEVTLTCGGKETIEYRGKPVETTLVLSESDIMPGMTSKAWIDAEGRTLRGSQPLMAGVDLIMELATKEEALDEDMAGGDAPDLMIESFSRCDKRIPHPQKVDEALYRIRFRETAGKVRPDFGADRRQTVEESSEDEMLLRITRLEPEPGKATRPMQDVPEELRPALEPSSGIQCDHEGIAAKARVIVGEETDAWRAAQKLERWVYEHIDKKGFGVAFASAGEVFEEGQGDCTEHAVLLAAMCRAAGIPARVAMGLVYWNGIFGGHAWTEVFVDDWYALDATSAFGGVGASHLTLATGNMADDEGMESFVTLSSVLGGMDLDVLELRYGPHRVDMTKTDSLFTLEGDHYSNKILGVAFSKPVEWEWDHFERTGLSSDVAEMEPPRGNDQFSVQATAVPYAFGLEDLVSAIEQSGQKIEAKKEISVDGRAALMLEEAPDGSFTRCAAAVLVGDTLFTFKARCTSSKTRALFDAFLGTVDFDLGIMTPGR